MMKVRLREHVMFFPQGHTLSERACVEYKSVSPKARQEPWEMLSPFPLFSDPGITSWLLSVLLWLQYLIQRSYSSTAVSARLPISVERGSSQPEKSGDSREKLHRG